MHIPLLRGGQPYKSLKTSTLTNFETGEPVAVVSQANSGLIAKDLANSRSAKIKLEEYSVAELVEISRRAASAFMNETLPMGDNQQSPEHYVKSLSSTSGMPQSLCRKNMAKIEKALKQSEIVLRGLTRGMNLEVLDKGWREENNQMFSFACETEALGCVLPSNSPGVHSLWLPSIPLKVPLALRPGSQEPWTPYRITQAFIAAGCPREAFGFYPSDHNGANEILMRTGRSMLFGDRTTVKPWLRDHRVQIHGPGWSKILFGEDLADTWEDHLDLMENSVGKPRGCSNQITTG